MKCFKKNSIILATILTFFTLYYVYQSTHQRTPQNLLHFSEAEKTFTDQKAFAQYKKQLQDYYTSEHYEKDVQIICANAQQYFSQISVKPNSAVIFDVDDTALYNWHPKGDFIWSQPPFAQQWQQKIKPAIAPVLKLYKALQTQGFKMIFLTSRSDNDFENTKKELENAGYTNFEKLILMPVKLAFDTNIKTAEWKLAVRKELAKNYIIVGSVGDRPADFQGGQTGYIVKLLNYLY